MLVLSLCMVLHMLFGCDTPFAVCTIGYVVDSGVVVGDIVVG